MTTAELVRWRYQKIEANSANFGGLLQRVNDASEDGWELVEFTYADKTLGLNSIMAILRKALDHPPAPADPSAGWHPDPLGQAEQRLWNGQVWTVHVRGSHFENQLEAEQEAASKLGQNPTNACRADEHDKCKRKWCTCACHQAAA